MANAAPDFTSFNPGYSLPQVRDRAAAIGFEPMPMSRDELQAFFRKDVADTEALVKAANIPLQQ